MTGPNISPLELTTQRRLTDAFIDASWNEIELTMRARVRTSSGGWIWELGTTRPPQRFKLVEPTEPNSPITTGDGVVRIVEFELVGRWDADVSIGDVFTYDNSDCEIIELYPFNGYEVRARVSFISDGPAVTP